MEFVLVFFFWKQQMETYTTDSVWPKGLYKMYRIVQLLNCVCLCQEIEGKKSLFF